MTMEDKTIQESVARIDERTKNISSKVDELQEMLSNGYVTKEEFSPVKSVAYGMVAVILMTVFGSIISLVLIKGA